jgi:ubiquitin-protein ligase
MSGQRDKRVQKEFMNLNKKPIEGVKVSLIKDDMTNWNLVIPGPVSINHAQYLTHYRKELHTKMVNSNSS